MRVRPWEVGKLTLLQVKILLSEKGRAWSYRASTLHEAAGIAAKLKQRKG